MTHEERMQVDLAYRAEALAERERCGAILRHGLDIGHYEVAKGLAFETDMEAEDAIRVLDRLPPPPPPPPTRVVREATDFRDHMRRVAPMAEDPDETELAATLTRMRARERRPS